MWGESCRIDCTPPATILSNRSIIEMVLCASAAGGLPEVSMLFKVFLNCCNEFLGILIVKRHPLIAEAGTAVICGLPFVEHVKQNAMKAWC